MAASPSDRLADLEIGETIAFTKTVGESDVYLFAGITGDNHRNHLDEEFMKTTVYGGRIAQGALLVGFMAACSSILCARLPGTVVSYGYDHVRFTAGVRLGDTVTTTYRLVRKDDATAKVFAEVRCTNQRGEIVAVATHILKFL